MLWPICFNMLPVVVLPLCFPSVPRCIASPPLDWCHLGSAQPTKCPRPVQNNFCREHCWFNHLFLMLEPEQLFNVLSLNLPCWKCQKGPQPDQTKFAPTCLQFCIQLHRWINPILQLRNFRLMTKKFDARWLRPYLQIWRQITPILFLFCLSTLCLVGHQPQTSPQPGVVSERRGDCRWGRGRRRGDQGLGDRSWWVGGWDGDLREKDDI